MRLAVFTSKYPARIATFFERDMRALLEQGIEIDVFAVSPLEADLWRYSLDLLGEDKLPRSRVHHLTLGDSVRRARPVVRDRGTRALRDAAAVLGSGLRFGLIPLAKTTYALPKAWAWVAEHGDRFDHVLGYWGNYAGSCAWAFHRLLDRPIPYSIWLHAGTDLYRTPVFMEEKLRYADNVITCCEFNRGFMLDRFAGAVPGLQEKIHVCHHGLDLAEFPFWPGDGPRPRDVVAVGRLFRRKGFDYLLRAVHHLRTLDLRVTLDLVGDGDERAALEALAARLGISDQVRFRGWLPFPETRRAMEEAAVLVHPSDGLGDGLPNVVREAMALGTPVIASRVAGIPDALGDGCGVLVPPRDIPALARAIATLGRDGEARRRIAERARRRVEERYDLWRNGAELARRLTETRRGNGKAPARLPAPASGVRVPAC